jgi:hypothetical protein
VDKKGQRGRGSAVIGADLHFMQSLPVALKEKKKEKGALCGRELCRSLNGLRSNRLKERKKERKKERGM